MTTNPTSPEPAPASTPAQELRLLGQIVTRVEKLSPVSQRWLRDRLIADLELVDEF